jgi:hypothetical protein
MLGRGGHKAAVDKAWLPVDTLAMLPVQTSASRHCQNHKASSRSQQALLSKLVQRTCASSLARDGGCLGSLPSCSLLGYRFGASLRCAPTARSLAPPIPHPCSPFGRWPFRHGGRHLIAWIRGHPGGAARSLASLLATAQRDWVIGSAGLGALAPSANPR